MMTPHMRGFRLVGLTMLFGAVSNLAVAQDDHEREMERLVEDVSFLAHDSLEGRETGTRGERLAAQYIADRFQELGLQKRGEGDTSYFQVFTKRLKLHPHDTTFGGAEIIGRNILGFIDNQAEHTVVIGAHYDHLGWGSEGSLHTGEPMVHNGADDNASGVAALLMLADRLAERPVDNNFLFIAFSGEEKGLLGSNHFVNKPGAGLATVNYMLNMDMVGRLDSARRLAIYGVGTSPAFIPAIHSVQGPEFEFKLDSSGMGPSDHTSFYVNDIPVLHFFTGQHAQYHRPEDDVELINFSGLHHVASFIDALILSLDDEGKVTFTKTRDKPSTRRSFKVTLGIMPDYLYSDGGLKVDGVKSERPGAKAGLLKGDVIVKMGELQVRDMKDYIQALGSFDKGDKVGLVVIRDEEEKTLIVEFD